MKAYLIATDESLASKMDTMDEHGNPMTDSLSPYLNRADAEHAVDNYNKAISSLETRVLVSARRFQELKASEGKELPAPGQIEVTPRVVESSPPM